MITSSTGTDVTVVNVVTVQTSSTPPYCDDPRILLIELLHALRDAFR
jgi:hypothetical protein